MSSCCYTAFPSVTNLLAKSCLCLEYKDSTKELIDETQILDSNVYDLEDLEEVFADHLLMGKRLRKTLYAGDFNGLDKISDHPPIALTGLALELFTKAVPNYGLDILDMDYVSSASEAARISPSAMIIAMIYLERLQMKNSDYLETVSPSGLFIVTMLVASKFLFEDEEDIVTNQMWSEALNFDVKDLNHLEYEFLSAIDWNIFVDSSDYFHYLCNIEKVIAVRQSSLRHWFSYSDIYVMMQDAAFQSFWTAFLKGIAKTTVLWTFGYVATALALYGTGIGLHRFMKVEKFSSQELTKNDAKTMDVPVHHHIESFHILDQTSSDVLIDNSFLPSVDFEIPAANNEDEVSFNQLATHWHVLHPYVYKRKRVRTDSDRYIYTEHIKNLLFTSL